MKFCVISPTSGLERYATLSDHQFPLVQNFNDPIYRKFYEDRRAAGDTLILDNGAYEGFPFDQSLMSEAMSAWKPQYVVCPDVIGGDRETNISSAFVFRERWRCITDTIWMAVIQPNMDWQDILDFKDGGFRAFGLPRSLMKTHPLERTLRAYRIRLMFPDIYLHALGMSAGDLGEFWGLRHAGIQSIDSSAPVWRGWHGLGLGPASREKWKEIGHPVDFSAPPPDPGADTQILANLLEVGLEPR